MVSTTQVFRFEGNAKANWFKNSEHTGKLGRDGVETHSGSLMLSLPENSRSNFFLGTYMVLAKIAPGILFLLPCGWRWPSVSTRLPRPPAEEGHLRSPSAPSLLICCDSVAGGSGAWRLLEMIPDMQLHT